LQFPLQLGEFQLYAVDCQERCETKGDTMFLQLGSGMNPVDIETRHAIVQGKPQLPRSLSAMQGYGLAVLSVAAALGGALLLELFHFRDVEVSLFLFAVAITAWYGGTRPAALASSLSSIGFDYFFVQPLYSFYISSSDHRP
jgi:K+-sensing histidine kinase KdpD